MEQTQTLEVVVRNSGLEVAESQTLLDKFGGYEKLAQDWDAKAHAIVVTKDTDLTEMAMAKEARKHFSQLRIDVEKARKAMKEQSLRKGQAIDAVAKYLVSLISPIEEYLKEQEDFLKIKAEKFMAEELARQAAKDEEERLEAEKKAKEEAEKIRLENEKMKAELEKKEKDRLELEAKTKKEKEEADKKLADERAEAQKVLDAEKKKAEEAKALADKEKKELEEKLASMVECPFCHKKFNL